MKKHSLEELIQIGLKSTLPDKQNTFFNFKKKTYYGQLYQIHQTCREEQAILAYPLT